MRSYHVHTLCGDWRLPPLRSKKSARGAKIVYLSSERQTPRSDGATCGVSHSLFGCVISLFLVSRQNRRSKSGKLSREPARAQAGHLPWYSTLGGRSARARRCVARNQIIEYLSV